MTAIKLVDVAFGHSQRHSQCIVRIGEYVLRVVEALFTGFAAAMPGDHRQRSIYRLQLPAIAGHRGQSCGSGDLVTLVELMRAFRHCTPPTRPTLHQAGSIIAPAPLSVMCIGTPIATGPGRPDHACCRPGSQPGTPADAKSRRKKSHPEVALSGGASRSRTDLHGFAIRCITALLSRRILAESLPILGWISAKPASATRRSVASPKIWSGRRGSNSRPQPWQGCALPAELLPPCAIFKTYFEAFVSAKLLATPRLPQLRYSKLESEIMQKPWGCVKRGGRMFRDFQAISVFSRIMGQASFM